MGANLPIVGIGSNDAENLLFVGYDVVKNSTTKYNSSGKDISLRNVTVFPL